jgi:hypothetical protein
MQSRFIFCAITAAALSACGGGGGTSTTGEVTPETGTLRGKVIDGYVQGAKVCLDLNKNDQCDSGEPSATTDVSGSYSLEYPKSAVLAETPVLVKIDVGSMDSTNGAVTKAYSMRTMGDSASVITPYTTLTSYEMKFNPGKTFNEISKAISQRLLGSPTAIDVASDFVAANRQDQLSAARALVASMQVAWGQAVPTLEQYQDFNVSAPHLAAWAFANPTATLEQLQLKVTQFTPYDYKISTLPISLDNRIPSSIAVDGLGNFYYTSGSDVIKVGLSSSNGAFVKLTLSGEITAIASDAAGNVYALVGNQLMKITSSESMVLAGSVSGGRVDGTGTQASFSIPQALTVGTDGKIYVADSGNGLIRLVDPSSGAVSTFMSGGSPLLVPDATAIAQGMNGTVYTISGAGIQSFTASGPGLTYRGSTVETTLPGWSSLVSDGKGIVFVTDVLRNKVWRIVDTPDLVNNVSLIAGTGQSGKTDGSGSVATFNKPYTLAIDKLGAVYINDLANRAIRVMR